MHYRWLFLLILFNLQGCNSATQVEPVSIEPPATATPPPAKKAVTQVKILVSDDTPAYMDVAKELTKALGPRSSLQMLSTSQVKNLEIIGNLKSSENTQFVSIGLNAALAGKALSNKAVVFCQVFNYQDYGLLSARHKGVSMLPAPAQVFKIWHNIASGASEIGVITGPGFEDLIDTARAAARSHSINLHHETVKSDKEFQFAYKKMSKHVQGFWLIPDNRILSGTSLREIMNYSVLNGKVVAVFNEEMLKLGGLFSITSTPREIALQVIERLEQAAGKDAIPGPDIVYPDRFKLRINSIMAKNLNIEVPEQYRKTVDAP